MASQSNVTKAQELLERLDKGIIFNKKPKAITAAKDPKKMIGNKPKTENGWKQTVAEDRITFEKAIELYKETKKGNVEAALALLKSLSPETYVFYSLKDLSNISREELMAGPWEPADEYHARMEKACHNGRTPDEEIPEDIYNAQMGMGANKKVEKNSEKAMKLLNKFTEGEIVNTSSGPMKSVGYYASQGNDPMTGKRKPDKFKQAFVPPNSTYNRRKSVEETLSPPEDKDPDYDDRGLNPSGNSYEPEPNKPKPLKQTTLDT